MCNIIKITGINRVCEFHILIHRGRIDKFFK
jgi:hypothetical protein